jgi:alanyl-tRNA synthetase
MNINLTFSKNGFVRKQCQKCGKFFGHVTLKEIHAEMRPVTLFLHRKPVFSREFNISEMREYYLSFFEARGHTRLTAILWSPLERRHLSHHSLNCRLPALRNFRAGTATCKPLTISQPCIRLNDLDSVGRSGRHLTNFEMMAHHAFNKRDNEIYWKEHTLELCDELLNSLKVNPFAVTYKEEPWAGGGNAGPCVEVIVHGLELAPLSSWT